MTTYHVNPDTGRANICRAKTLDACPLKTDDGSLVFHGENKEEAKQHGLNLLEKKYGAMGTTAKKGTQSAEPKTPEQLEKEIQKLEKKKDKVSDPDELKKIRAAIRGKKVAIKDLKDSAKKDTEPTSVPEPIAEKKPVVNSVEKKAPATKPSTAKGPVTLEKEIDDLRELKKRTTDPEEIKRINGEIRGKSIAVSRAKKAELDARGVLRKNPLKTTTTEEIPPSAIRVLTKQSVRKETAPAAQPATVSWVSEKILDDNVNINAKKAAIKEYLSNPESRAEVKREFEKNGYDFDNSSVVKGFINGEPGNNASLREAIRETKNNGDTGLADVLMNVEDTEYERSSSLSGDRFSAFSLSNFNSDTSEPDLDDFGDAPDFLQEDPDFVIEDDLEEDSDLGKDDEF